MPTLPSKFNNIQDILIVFAVHFRPQVWRYARVLVIGAILARSQRTVCSVLRVMAP